jgi:arabinose-5-phosphate isomerase
MIRQEASAVERAATTVDADSVEAAEATAACKGNVIVTGVGKAGLVGQKLVATLASTGTPAHFLHPTEAIHGDFGRVGPRDVVWALSNSGRSEEVVQIASQLRSQSSKLISFTSDDSNPLAEIAEIRVVYGRHPEACPNGLAPSSSTTVMMAVGDAVALLASQLREFSAEDFARFHPGGALGRKLSTVDQLMRPLESCRVALASVSVRRCMVESSKAGRRSGAVMLVDDSGALAGLFTDSDLARLLENRHENAMDKPVSTQMTPNPHCVLANTLLADAIALLSQHRISELPVIDDQRRPVGMLDITDLIAVGEVQPTMSSASATATIPMTL